MRLIVIVVLVAVLIIAIVAVLVDAIVALAVLFVLDIAMHAPYASDALVACHVVLAVTKGLMDVVAFQNAMVNANTV